MKKDGHTHTSFCLHGSREETEELIVKAIQLGFTSYSVMEHLPFPQDFLSHCPYNREKFSAASMLSHEMNLDCYVREMNRLKDKYKDFIELNVGFEVDYNPLLMEWTRGILRDYQNFIDEIIISVHYIQGREGWRFVALDRKDFKENVLDYYGTFEKFQMEYYRTVLEAVAADYKCTLHQRIGHISYCNKYRKTQDDGTADSPKVMRIVEKILEKLKSRGYSVDMNMSGLYKADREMFITPQIIKGCLQKNISLVYGSDAHCVDEIGQGYDIYRILVGSGVKE